MASQQTDTHGQQGQPEGAAPAPLPGARTRAAGPLPFRRTGDPADDALKILTGEAQKEAQAELAAAGGAPADPTLVSGTTSATGVDVSGAQVHADAGSASLAAGLGARAMTVGDDIHLGPGESANDKKLMAHELAHVAQQRAGESAGTPQRKGVVSEPGDALEVEADRVAEAVVAGDGNSVAVSPGPGGLIQRDTVGDVQSRLSYGAFDWAITDSEATEAFNMLIALPQPALVGALNRLGGTYRSRLLDNLPDSVKATSGYTRLIVAMGPDAAEPFVNSLLSYGVFDWAVTDSDAQQVFRILVALPDGQRRRLWTRLGAAMRARLAENLARSATLGGTEQGVLQSLFGGTPDAEIETLKKLAELRFRIHFGTEGSGNDWDAASLRQLWGVLETLPPSMVEANPNLRNFLRYGHAGSAGGEYRSDGDVAMGWGTGQLGAANQAADPTDPLFGVNRFDKVVRHEVGHSMEGRVNAAAYTATAPGGTWIEEPKAGIASRMVAASVGAIAGMTNATHKQQVIDCLQGIVDDRAPDQVDTRLDNCAAFATRTTDAAVATLLTNVKADQAVAQLKQCFESQAPWYRAANGGIALGGRIYQEKYENDWTSYAAEARARKVSLYQFRAAGEWFAEAFATYYEPGPPGALLAGVDAPSKAWFTANVDPAGGTGNNEAPNRTPGAPPPPAPGPPGTGTP